jgi:AcrR family transcriptional regulator
LDKSRKHIQRTTEERQREIADATLKLVVRYGVHGATVTRIAAAVGLSRAALYKHFPNRDAMLAAAMDLMDERSPKWLSQASGGDAFLRLMNMGDSHASWAASLFETLIRPVYQFVAARERGLLTDIMRERHLQFLQTAIELVEEGKREGSIREDADSQDVVWGLQMFAWAEDMARLVGLDEMITSGASIRLFGRLLGDISTAPSTDCEGLPKA